MVAIRRLPGRRGPAARRGAARGGRHRDHRHLDPTGNGAPNDHHVPPTRRERKRPSSGWASLTPTELDVVKVVATGLTTPEIGERLFIGRGTVKTHLAHVFTKLGVSTRSELAAEVTRRGL